MYVIHWVVIFIGDCAFIYGSDPKVIQVDTNVFLCPADLEEQGMYRVSGLTSEILELKERFDSGDKIDFSRYTDISVVCGAVKLYLRELPIPVVSYDAYNEVMKATCKYIELIAGALLYSVFVVLLILYMPKAVKLECRSATTHSHSPGKTIVFNKSIEGRYAGLTILLS